MSIFKKSLRNIIFPLILFVSSACGSEDEESSSDDFVPEGPNFVLGALEESKESLKSSCGSDVRTLPMPIDHNNPAETFDYRYQYMTAQTSAQTTVVHLPGGPGQGYMGADRDSYPAQFNHILIDPRTLGCNYQSSSVIANDFVSTRQHAADIVAIVKTLGLDNYVLYGISYGTVVATVAADLIRQDATINVPRAIVFEGIVGEPSRGTAYNDAFKQQWDLRLEFIPGLQAVFSNAGSLPFGYSSDQWTSILNSLLSIGGEIADSFLYAAVDPRPYDVTVLKAILDGFLQGGASPLGTRRFYQQVGCRELFDDNRYFNYLSSGDFKVFDANDYLAEGVTLEAALGGCSVIDMNDPYDPISYTMADVPTYYFQGRGDPNTPIAEAKIHFNAKSELSAKYFIEIAHAGHNPFSIQLDDCSDKVWEHVLAGTNPFGDIITSRGCVSSILLRNKAFYERVKPLQVFGHPSSWH